MDSSSRPNQMIRLRYMNDTGTPNKIMTLREIKNAAVQYVMRYLGTDEILDTIDRYGSAYRFENWRITYSVLMSTPTYERFILRCLEIFYRRWTLFGGHYHCGLTDDKSDIRQAVTAKDTISKFANWSNGFPSDYALQAFKIGGKVFNLHNTDIMTSMQASIEGMQKALAMSNTPLNFDTTYELKSHNYLAEWQKLKPEVRQYITARVFGFKKDPMFDVLTGDTGDYEEVTVSCKLDVSSQQSLMHTVGIPFVKKGKSHGFTAKENTAFIEYTDTIEIPTLKKGNEYYLDYRDHRSDIKGLNFVTLIWNGLGLERNATNTIRTSLLFRAIPDAHIGTLLSDDGSEYKRTVDEPPSSDENINRLKADSFERYPPPGSFDFAIQYHKITNRYDRVSSALTLTMLDSYTGSVLGYNLPFKVVENDGGAWATFAPMKAHQGFNAKNVPVYRSRVAPTAASIVASLNRPSVQNVVGMALQAIPAGKAGDVILYDSV